MAEPTREDLDREARSLGLDPDDYRTKGELDDAILQTRGSSALGPHEGADAENLDAPEPSGKAVTAVQPMTADDIPEGLR